MKDMGLREYMLYDAQKKQPVLAFVLCFFFGMVGAHRFYMGRFSTGALQLLLFLGGIATTWLLVGYVPLALVCLWVIVDCFLVLGWVRQHNFALLNRLERAHRHADDVDAVGTLESVAQSPVPGSVNESGKRLAAATIGVAALVALAAIGDHEVPTISWPWRGDHISTDHGSVSVQQENIGTDASVMGSTLGPPPKPTVPEVNKQDGNAAAGNFVVQLGQFSEQDRAQTWADELRNKLHVPIYVERRELPESVEYLLRMGPFESREQAQAAIAKVRAAGYERPPSASR